MICVSTRPHATEVQAYRDTYRDLERVFPRSLPNEYQILEKRLVEREGCHEGIECRNDDEFNPVSSGVAHWKNKMLIIAVDCRQAKWCFRSMA